MTAEQEFELLRLRRQLVWDMVSHSDLIEPANQRRFGLQPASIEVVTAEHYEADARLQRVAPYYEHLMTISALSASILRSTILELLAGCSDDEEFDAHLGVILTITSTAALSELLDKRLVLNPHREVRYRG